MFKSLFIKAAFNLLTAIQVIAVASIIISCVGASDGTKFIKLLAVTSAMYIVCHFVKDVLMPSRIKHDIEVMENMISLFQEGINIKHE